MKGNVVMLELTGEERKRVIAEFERYEEEESRFVDELKRLIDGNAYDHIKGHIEAFYDAWEEHKGITLLMEDIQAALSKQDEAVKPALLPIWRDFVNEKIGGFPIVETCTVLNGLKRDLMLLRLGDIIDYRIAKAMIQTYFESEKGRECLNDISVYMLHAGKSKIRRCKNTCNEAELYPLLYREALRQLEKTKIGKDYKDAAKGHLIQFMKEWENTRKDEAVKPQQVPQKRKGAPNKSNKDIRDCIQGEDKSLIERLKRLTLNTDGSRKRGNAFYLYIGVCVKEGWFVHRPTYGQIKAEFGDVGCQSGYNKYMSSKDWTEAEHKSIKNAIKAGE